MLQENTKKLYPTKPSSSASLTRGLLVITLIFADVRFIRDGYRSEKTGDNARDFYIKNKQLQRLYFHFFLSTTF